jgi:hypothetical protein
MASLSEEFFLEFMTSVDQGQFSEISIFSIIRNSQIQFPNKVPMITKQANIEQILQIRNFQIHLITANLPNSTFSPYFTLFVHKLRILP